MSSDVSSLTGSSAPTSSRPSTPPHFNSIIRTESTVTTGQKRKREKTIYTCRICQTWGPSSHRVNTILHVQTQHLISDGISHEPGSSQQQDIPTLLSLSLYSTLRARFNEQKYREALISLLTHRRLPFSVVEWPELKDLTLAGNHAIEDLLITSRRQAVRHIASNYVLFVRF
jgi:hypothetical protein